MNEELGKLSIDDLTELAELGRQAKSGEHRWIGEYVIVRCKDAGVHAGQLVSFQGRECELKESRRLWQWQSSGGEAFLSGVARHGIEHGESKVGGEVSIILTENCEIILTTTEAAENLRTAPVWEI